MDRRRLLFAVWMTVLALPLLIVDNLPTARARGQRVVEAASSGSDDGAEVSQTTLKRRAHDDTTTTTTESTTTTSTSSTTSSTTTTTAPGSTTTEHRHESTTTSTTEHEHPSTTTTSTTAAPPPSDDGESSGNVEEGQASWYDWEPGTCAHRTLPFGTVVTVTNLENGARATCRVADRGPESPERVIDLDDEVFVKLAPLSDGIIPVRITW